MPERAIDLSPLNEAERLVLGLLAQGHTAKSIAARQGATVGAVNERLREARRKTGAGSSRELARMLVSQENRDEKIGVGDRAPSAQPSGRNGAPSVARRTLIGGAIAMIIIAAGLAALAIHYQQTPVARLDPTDPAALQQRVQTEARDPAWAPTAEAALKGRYMAVPHIGEPLTVQCGSTLCEVTGQIGPERDGKTVDATMQALQSQALDGDVRQLGFGDPLAHTFKTDNAKPGQVRFAIFWPRH